MVATGLVLVGVGLGVMLLFTVLAIWLTEKTLKGEEGHDEGPDGRPH